jgi:hypothetical protein
MAVESQRQRHRSQETHEQKIIDAIRLSITNSSQWALCVALIRTMQPSKPLQLVIRVEKSGHLSRL